MSLVNRYDKSKLNEVWSSGLPKHGSEMEVYKNHTD